MCDPTVLAIGSLAIKSVGDVTEAVAQNRNAAANKTAAIASQAGQVNDVNLREIQEKQAETQQLQAAARQTTTALSSARLSAGEAGVKGASVDALLTDIGAQGSSYAEDVKLNGQNTQAQLERQKQGIYAQTQDRINSVQPANPLATALKIGGNLIGTAAQLEGRNAPSDGVTPSAVTPRSSLRIGTTSPGSVPLPQFQVRGARSIYGI